MNKSLLSTLIITVLGTNFAHAETLDAGSISRQAEQDIPIQPQTVNLQKLEQTAVSTDNTPIEVKHIQLNGRALLSLEEIQPVLNEYIGTTTTFGGLQQLAQKVAHVYHKAGYPLAQAVIPPQRIENGVIVLQVIEGKIASVNVQNQSRLSDKVAENYLTRAIQPNAPLKQADSERALLLIKGLAGTKEAHYRLSDKGQGAELVANLGKAPLVDGFVMLDNYGSRSTGKTRTRAGLNINSPFGRGERFSTQAMSSFKGVNYARLSMDTPIGYHGLSTSLGVGHTRYDLGGAFKDLDATGNATTVDWSMRYPLLLSNQRNVSLFGGVEYRKLKDEIGVTDTVTRKKLHSVNVGVNGWSRYGSGVTQFNLINTLGRLDIKSADALAIDKISAKTDGGYYKLNASLSHTQYLTPKFSMRVGVNGQWANKNLDSAEQLSLGGADAVVAYHSNDVSADQGLIGQLELAYAVSPYVSVLAFYDYGQAKLRRNPYIDWARNSVHLHGGGVGLNAQYKGFFAETKLAFAGKNGDLADIRKSKQWWVKAGYQF